MDKQSVLLLDHSMPTILAFQEMYARGMTGAAVKAEGHQMIANLSISDLRLAYKSNHTGLLISSHVASRIAVNANNMQDLHEYQNPTKLLQPYCSHMKRRLWCHS